MEQKEQDIWEIVITFIISRQNNIKRIRKCMDTHILKVLENHYPKGFPFEKYQGFAGVLQQYILYYDLMGGKQK